MLDIKAIGKKIYYDISTGEIIAETSERSGNVIETTIEEDIQTFKKLSERNREAFDFIKLEYGRYSQDFIECNGCRVNPETRDLEFSYPNPSQEEPQEPIYQRPLSEQVKELETRTQDIELALAEIFIV